MGTGTFVDFSSLKQRPRGHVCAVWGCPGCLLGLRMLSHMRTTLPTLCPPCIPVTLKAVTVLWPHAYRGHSSCSLNTQGDALPGNKMGEDTRREDLGDFSITGPRRHFLAYLLEAALL